MTPVTILGIHLDPHSGATLVLLGEGKGINRVLPIFVGPSEAASIAAGLAGEVPPRPHTHDLLLDIVAAFDGDVTEVRITDLVDGTFLAEVELETTLGKVAVSSRPSDGMALASRLGLTVLVDPSVFDRAAVEVQHEPELGFEEDEIEDIVEEFRGFLESAQPGDFMATDDPDTPDKSEPPHERDEEA